MRYARPSNGSARQTCRCLTRALWRTRSRRRPSASPRPSARSWDWQSGVDLLDKPAVFELFDHTIVDQLIDVQIFGFRILCSHLVDHLQHAIVAGIRRLRPERSVRVVTIIGKL